MKKTRIFLSVIFVLATLGIMIMIFRFSCDTGTESAELSHSFFADILAIFSNPIVHTIFRKLAHFTEYAMLGFFMCGSFRFISGKQHKFYIPLIPCVLYAISDEIHQYFVPERSCEIFDVCVDSLGCLCGIVIFLLVIKIVKKIVEKSKISKA